MFCLIPINIISGLRLTAGQCWWTVTRHDCSGVVFHALFLLRFDGDPWLENGPCFLDIRLWLCFGVIVALVITVAAINQNGSDRVEVEYAVSV